MQFLYKRQNKHRQRADLTCQDPETPEGTRGKVVPQGPAGQPVDSGLPVVTMFCAASEGDCAETRLPGRALKLCNLTCAALSATPLSRAAQLALYMRGTPTAAQRHRASVSELRICIDILTG